MIADVDGGGVKIVGDKEVWAGDGDSTVKVISLSSFSIVDTAGDGWHRPE
jgi:hypothetical protein